MLALSSSVFKTMLEKRWTSDGTKNVITLIEDSETISGLLNFVYTGQVEKSKVNFKLLIASDKYDIEPLKGICEKNLGEQFEKFENVDELVEAAIATHNCGSKEYQYTIVSSLAANWTKVKESSEYQAVKDDGDLLSKIISFLTS